MSTANSNPYDLWQRSKLLGVMRDTKPEEWMFRDYFTRTVLATEEYIDFEKLPVMGRKIAPYVLPKGRGHGVYSDRQTAYRFKPANVVVEEAVDDSKGLTFEAGIDQSMIHQELNIDDPMVRRNLLKAQMAAQAVLAVERRWEQQRAEVLRTGKLSITYLSGESYLLDFQRAAAHTEVLTSGNRFGDSGVSIVDKFQQIVDTMNDADFGGVPVKVVMRGAMASILRKDTEFLSHMDKFVDGGSIEVVRGLIAGASGGGKTYKFGTMAIGGASGQKIELWVNNETYEVAGQRIPYIQPNEILFLSTPDAIMGHMCFGRIQDLDARFQALPIFPKNFVTGERVKTENLSFESAPLAVPINPNGTYLLRATA